MRVSVVCVQHLKFMVKKMRRSNRWLGLVLNGLRSPVIRVIKRVIRGRNMDLICVRGAVYFTPGLCDACWRDHFNLVVCALRCARTPCGPFRRRPRQKMILLYAIHRMRVSPGSSGQQQKRALLEGTLGDNCRLHGNIKRCPGNTFTQVRV